VHGLGVLRNGTEVGVKELLLGHYYYIARVELLDVYVGSLSVDDLGILGRELLQFGSIRVNNGLVFGAQLLK